MEKTLEIISPQLKDGSEWSDHEDCIVGNEEGLKSLINACQVALKDGEYYGNELGDYVGVKKLENHWFKNPKDSKTTRLANAGLIFFLVLLITCTCIGIATVFNWLF